MKRKPGIKLYVIFFITQHHRRALDSVQPALFGLCLYELRSLAAAAGLLHQPPFEIAVDIFVRFVAHNNILNHRAVHGFRIGWLMLLGNPLYYRTTFDLSSTVATFGMFHHWHHDDVVLDRALVFASYPSAQLVPHDVVISH
jgi:hypothetical protein